jgi:hypothetical protein
MRSLIISIISLACIITPWGIFMSYADQSINDMAKITKNQVMEEVASENWSSAEDTMKKVSKKWYDSRKAYSVFMSAQSIDNIESALVKTKAYIQAQEKSAALGELANFHHQLLFTLENERINIENIM